MSPQNQIINQTWLLSKVSSRRPFFISLITALLICAAFHLNAQNISASESYGSIALGQGNSDITGTQLFLNNACVPTATANGLAYMEAYQESLGNPSPFSSTPNSYTAVNALASDMSTSTTGTTALNAINGLNTYLSANANASVVATQITDPTASQLGAELTANDAVQLGITWGSISGSTFTAAGGGHFVSITGISIDLTGGSGTGTMTILDPWGLPNGSANAGISASSLSVKISTVTLTGIGPVLDVTYNSAGITYPNQPEDTTADNSTASFGNLQFPEGYIALDEFETVPEPTTLALLGAGALALLAKRRWQA
jgi:hypothetical protein